MTGLLIGDRIIKQSWSLIPKAITKEI